MLVLYADVPDRRNRQIVADSFALVWLGVAAWSGILVERTLAAPARSLARSTRELGDISDRVASSTDSVTALPLVGDRLSEPLRQISGTARSVSETSNSVSDTLLQTAHVAGLVVGIGLSTLLLLLWLPWRLRFIVGAARMRRVLRRPGAQELLALRALSTAPLPRLQQVCADPVGAWARHDPGALHELADLALHPYGLTWPQAPPRPSRGSLATGNGQVPPSRSAR